MNNSILQDLELEESVDVKPTLRKKETELLSLIEAIESLLASDYWKLLEEMEFGPTLQQLRSRLGREKDSIEIYRLQGQVERAEKSDLRGLLKLKRNELLSVKAQLNG